MGKLSEKEVEFVISVVEVVAKHGIPAVAKIIGSWTADKEPTLEEIRAMRSRVATTATFLD